MIISPHSRWPPAPVIQPGEVQQAEFIDGFVPASVVRAQIRILKAMPLRPFVATSAGGS